MRRKFLSVLLALSMVLTMVPVTALALDAPEAPAALGEDDVTVAATSITINASVAENEYAVVDNTDGNAEAPAIDAADWKPGTDDALEISGLTAKTKYKVYQRIAEVAADDTADPPVAAVPASDASPALAVVTLPETPSALTEAGLTVAADSITVKNPDAENEYACVPEATGGETAAPTSGWVAGSSSEVKFAGLEAGTAYVVFVRVAADAANGIPASEAASTEVTTKAAPISKVTITLAKPVTGTAANAVPGAATEAATYEVTTTTWADGEAAPLTGKVKGNTAYTATVTLTAKDTIFAENVTVDDVAGAKTTTKGERAADGSTLTVTVEFDTTAAATVSTLTITTPPTKVTYNVGESFDPKGMVVKATYNDDTTNVAYTNYTCEVADPLTADTTKVVVKDKTNANAKAEQAITVTKEQVALTIATPTASEITYGDPLSESTITTGAVTNAGGEAVTGGSWAWKDGTLKLDAGDDKTAVAVYTPPTSTTKEYTDAAGSNFERTVTVAVAKADITHSVPNQSMKNDAPALSKITTGSAVKGVGGAEVNGAFTWFKDAECTENAVNDDLTGTSVQLYWKFTPANGAAAQAHDGDNYNVATGGPVTITMTEKDVLELTFANGTSVTKEYGEAVANALTIKKNGTVDSTIAATYSVTPAAQDVVTVDENTGVVTVNKVGGPVTITAAVDNTGEAYDGGTSITASYTLTISKRAITITAADKTIDQGAPLPSFTASVTSGSVADGEALDTIPVTCSATDSETAGTFPIVIGDVTFTTGDASNYEITKVNGTLTINAVDRDTVATPVITPASSQVSGTVNVTITCGTGEAKIHYTTDGSTPTKSSPEYTAAFDVTSPATVKAIAVKAGMNNSAVATAEYTVPSKKPSGGGSGGSGGGGGSTSSTVTVPVSGDDNSVEVSAKVSGSTATIDKIDGLDKVLDSDADTGVVEIDLTALKKDIDTVSISASSIEDIAKAAADSDNDVDGLAIKLDSGTVEFDADALEAIVDQATSSSIQLVLEKTNSSDLNSSQRDAVKDMDIHGHFDLTLTGGKVITDFKGGRVSVRIPFTVPSGKDAANFVVIYVANDGTVEEMRTSCSGGYISFTTDHFSKYLIAYKDSEPVEPVETPETADCDGGANCPAGKFTDVNTDLWYHKAIDYVLTNGLMSGVGDGTFAPNANLSRAMLAQILYNQEGRPAASADSVFDDVAAGMWYTNAIAWAAENGVVSGLGDGKFGPNNNITREQLAVMLYRYAGSPSAAGGGSLDRFADADKASGYAKDALVWATGMGIMSGKGGGMLDPQGQATRAEVAQMLYNYLNK